MTTEWFRVLEAKDLKENTWQVFYLDTQAIMVVHLPEGIFAIDDICSHDGGTLSDGDLEGCEMICPRHGARFDVRTGAVTAPPAYEPIKSYPVRIEDGWIEIGLD